ncbi:hypothetical protein D3Z39_09495 [Anaerotruncus colihominis]|uniref:Uncharacterized protein n=1 Tax=Anaerotruncus colihominis TaxID=169435 RepID=A0A845RK07_9FIRM|nr:hypothetical protein [Anaerotruncus colihominis]
MACPPLSGGKTGKAGFGCGAHTHPAAPHQPPDGGGKWRAICSAHMISHFLSVRNEKHQRPGGRKCGRPPGRRQKRVYFGEGMLTAA